MTLAANKVQYQIDNYLKDPKAENHAKQLEKEQKLRIAAEKRKEALNESTAQLKVKSAKDRAEAEELARRSQFSSPQSFAGKVGSNMLSTFKTLVLVGFALYAGKIEANKAIGYSVPMRIVSFIYGALLFFIVIPRSLYEIYGLEKKIPDYAPLPIWNYVPNGWVEKIFFGLFSYVEDANSKAARE